MLGYLSGESKVPYSQVTGSTVDEDIIALDVPVDHVLCVEELKTLENLSAPPLHSIPTNHRVFP